MFEAVEGLVAEHRELEQHRTAPVAPSGGRSSACIVRRASVSGRDMSDQPLHLLIIGGGPAGTQAATTAATHGAKVTLVERDIVGGAAHLWDCIPSKTMAASALRQTSVRNAVKLGLVNDPPKMDPVALSARIKEITADINENWVDLLSDQRVDLIGGTGRYAALHQQWLESLA